MLRKHYDHFHIAGFSYYDGVLAFNKLKIGTELILKTEQDNHYDENAVAIYYNEHKLGFVPSSHNEHLAFLLNAGYNIFETRVQQVNSEVHPEKQIHVFVFLKGKND